MSDDHGSIIPAYMKVFYALCAFTVLTVAAAKWMHFPESWGTTGDILHVGIGIVIAVMKVVMVMWIFMHLKFDSKLFSFMFYAGLFLAVGVYATFLATFKFFIQ